MSRGLLVVVLIGALLAVAGIAFGAATQGEEFLRGAADSDLAHRDASGSLIVVTAMLSALGVGIALIALRNHEHAQAWWPAAVLVAATWLCIVLFQTDLPNYTAIPEQQQATLSQTHLVREADGSPSVLVPVLAMIAGGLMLIQWAVPRVLGAAGRHPSAVADHAVRLGLTAPFLVLLAAGSIRVLLALPAMQGSGAMALVLLPVTALAAIGLLGILVARQEVLRRWVRAPHMAPVARESLRAIARLQTILVGVLLAAALASTFLPKTDLPETSLGRSLVLTLRSHGQGAAFALIPLAGLLTDQRRLHAEVTEHGRIDHIPGMGLYVAVAASVVGAIVATAFGQALLPWIVAFTPIAIWAALRVRAIEAAPIMVLGAWLLWARGNTIIGSYDGSMFPPLSLATPPGLLALWRLSAVMLLGWLAFRLAQHAGRREKTGTVVPLAAAIATAIGLIALIELPLAAWSLPGGGDDTVAVGSLIASQSPAVRTVAHVVTSLAGVGAAAALARLLRPGWFRRRRTATGTATGEPEQLPA